MSKIVTIYGGSGSLGRQIARQMAKEGWRVRVAVRRPNEALFVRTYGAVGQVEPVPCNIRDETSVRAAMADADAVINCVGILVNEGKNRFAPVQVEGAERVARIAAENGITNFVHISAIGADPESPSHYAATKGEGEAAVLRHQPKTLHAQKTEGHRRHAARDQHFCAKPGRSTRQPKRLDRGVERAPGRPVHAVRKRQQVQHGRAGMTQ